MRKQFRNYFIGNYLNSGDVFERARAIMLFRFSIIFAILFILPITADYLNGYDNALVLHIADELLLISFPFVIKYSRRLDFTINLFVVICFIGSMGAVMIFNPPTINAPTAAWAFFFLILSALLQKGWARILYCGFFGWVPSIYVLLNSQLNGALTWEAIVDVGVNEPPAAMAVLPAILAVFAIWNHTQTIEEAKGMITKQKAEIEEKNQNITDSITYAKRIQEAILPDKEQIYAALPNSFVIYKPKDIVSGDFYFFAEQKNCVLLAAADCTGHGVPGAFMSMIGSEKLKEASQVTNNVSEILNMVNNGIRESLKQSDAEDSTRDGMDIALCSIDSASGTVQYAGAYRNLWIVRKDSDRVEEIKATKKAIAGFTEKGQIFELHDLKLEKGDSIYLSTDGYADSFNGITNKKLTTKKFKELILSIQEKSMKSQQEALSTFIEEWMGNSEQIDDILVIGVRL